METIIVDIGNRVVCDLCNADYTNSDESGGFIFQSKAVCPECETPFLETIIGYQETNFIRSRCPRGVSFKDYILNMR